jgi:hypothetical protein
MVKNKYVQRLRSHELHLRINYLQIVVLITILILIALCITYLLTLRSADQKSRESWNSKGCYIKGGQDGYYYLPGHHNYEKVVLDDGTNWFCEPKEAEVWGYKVAP